MDNPGHPYLDSMIICIDRMHVARLNNILPYIIQGMRLLRSLIPFRLSHLLETSAYV